MLKNLRALLEYALKQADQAWTQNGKCRSYDIFETTYSHSLSISNDLWVK